MAKKTWAGSSQTSDDTVTAGDYAAADNWEPISLRNATYRWLQSSTSTEYYLDLAGGGDPGVPEPGNVQEFIAGIRTNLAAGTAGSLNAGEWDYADNDTLGYSTIYVRVSSGTADPDSRVLDYITYTAIPVAGDDVRVPAGSLAMTSNLDQSAVAISDFIVEAGSKNAIGGEGNVLYIDPDRFEFSGTGESWIDIKDANITARISATKSPQTGKHGLYLTGSDIAVVDVQGGNVGVAAFHGQSSTVGISRVSGQGKLTLGESVTLTTHTQVAGEATLNCAATTVTVNAGTLRTYEQGAITTLNANGGESYLNSTGTIGTLNINNGARADFSTSDAARTVTTANTNHGTLVQGSGLTITNDNSAANSSRVVTPI